MQFVPHGIELKQYAVSTGQFGRQIWTRLQGRHAILSHRMYYVILHRIPAMTAEASYVAALGVPPSSTMRHTCVPPFVYTLDNDSG